MQKLTDRHINAVLDDSGLTPGARVFFVRLVDQARRGVDWFNMSHSYMCSLVDKTRSTVIRYLLELEAAGYLVKRGNAAVTNGFKHRTPNSYRLIPPLLAGFHRVKTRMQEAMQRIKAARAIKARAVQQMRGNFALCTKMNPWESETSIYSLDLGTQSAMDALKQMQQERRKREFS